MHPSFNQLIQLARTLAHDYDFVRVVTASQKGKVQFIEVSEGPVFCTELQQVIVPTHCCPN